MSGSAQVIANMAKWYGLKKAGIEGMGRVAGANMVNYARKQVVEEHVWEVQTGAAHGGLNAGAFWQNPFCLIIYLAHAVSYGVYLELANDGKHAVLEPTVNKFAPTIHKNAKRIMGVP